MTIPRLSSTPSFHMGTSDHDWPERLPGSSVKYSASRGRIDGSTLLTYPLLKCAWGSHLALMSVGSGSNRSSDIQRSNASTSTRKTSNRSHRGHVIFTLPRSPFQRKTTPATVGLQVGMAGIFISFDSSDLATPRLVGPGQDKPRLKQN